MNLELTPRYRRVPVREGAVVAAAPQRLRHVASELVLQSAAARQAASDTFARQGKASPGRGRWHGEAWLAWLSSAAASKSPELVPTRRSL